MNKYFLIKNWYMKAIFTALIVCLSMGVFAQQKTVTGTVTESNTGKALPNVSVQVRGSQRGTLSREDGTYAISVQSNDVLTFSAVDHQTESQRVGDRNIINVTLQRTAANMDEVVVTGYGIKRQKRELGYSTQEVKGEELSQTKRENLINTLAGRVAGATIVSTSGMPGASAQITLRGAISLNGRNQPLFVVDGLVIDNSTFNQDNLVSSSNVNSGVNFLNRQSDYSNRAIDLNPDDIESVTVLKGPEAMTIYGSEGASGAIVITTKQAKKGKAQVNYDYAVRFERTYSFPEIQDLYAPGRNGLFDPTIRFFGGPKFADTTQRFDNIHNFFRTGITHKHNASIEGGSDAVGFRLSFSYNDQDGVVPNTNFKRFTTRMSGNMRISRKMNVNGSVTYSNSKNIKASKGTGGFLFSLLTWPGDDDIREYLNPDGTRRKIYPVSTTEVDNPLFDVYKNANTDNTNRMTANLNYGYDVTPWININMIGGVDFYSTQGNYFRHPESRYGFATLGYVSDYTNNYIGYNAVAKATFKKKIGILNNTLIVGFSYDDISTKAASQKGEKLSVADFNSLRNADPTTIAVLNTLNKYRKEGLFATYTAGLGKYVYGSLTYRRDWDSRLVAPNLPGRPIDYKIPWFDFYGTSLSYVFTEHNFMKEQRVLNFGKLRFSYSNAGKPPYINYQLGPTYGSNLYMGGGYFLNSTLGNPGIKPERTKNLEIGTELRFFKDLFSIDFAWYKIKSLDQLLNVRTSYGTGSIITWLNGGEIENKGFELQLKTTPWRTKDAKWTATINLDRNVGKIISLPGGVPEYSNFQTFGAGDVRPITYPGAFTSSFSTRKYQRNTRGDILIDPSSGLPLKESVYSIAGDRNPRFKIGFVNDVTYKNFVLSINTDIRWGGDIYNGNESFLFANMLSKNTLDRETPRIIKGVLKDGLENTSTPTANNISITPYFSNNYYDLAGSTSTTGFSDEDFIEKNIKWFRIRDLTLAYKLPGKFLAKTKSIRNARIYCTLTDLLMISNYSGADPNTNYLTPALGGFGGGGIDFGNLATPRGVNLGISLNF